MPSAKRTRTPAARKPSPPAVPGPEIIARELESASATAGGEPVVRWTAAQIWSVPSGFVPLESVVVYKLDNHWHYLTVGSAVVDAAQRQNPPSQIPPAPTAAMPFTSWVMTVVSTGPQRDVGDRYYELSMRLGGDLDVPPPLWPARLLWNMGCRRLLENYRVEPGFHFPLTSTIASHPEIKWFAATFDPGWRTPIHTPIGDVHPLQLVGLHEAEAAAFAKTSMTAVLARLAQQDPWLRTCVTRSPVTR